MAIVAGVVIVADQLSKWWAVNALSDRDIDLVWTLRFHLALNHGASFSLVPGRGALIGLIALAVVIVLVVLGRAIDTRPGAIALGLVLGGALGNLLDRAFRHGTGFLGGGVVDFIDPQWWPIFNVADAAISIGGILLILVTSFAPAEPHADRRA